MKIVFGDIPDLPRGSLFQMLTDAYSFDSRCAECWSGDWRAFDDFFFDHPEIARRCGFVSWLGGEPGGFVSWDPRRGPDWFEIGHNCIIGKFKGHGFGAAQMREAVRRISEECPPRIRVSTSELLLPAQKMYESVGFVRIGRLECTQFFGDRIDYEFLCGKRGEM